MWRVWGEKMLDADLDGSDLRKHQKIKAHRDFVLRGIRSWFVFFNDPTFTDLRLKIYNDKNILIATSTGVLTKAEALTTEINAVKEFYFEFDLLTLKGTDTYRVRPEATGYVFDELSHIAWVSGYPDPVYLTGITSEFKDLMTAPYRVLPIGADL